MQLKERLKYNNRKIKAKIHLVSKFCPSKPVGEKGKGRKGEKRKERREKGKKIVEQGGRCDFFLLLQAFQVLYKWYQGRGAKGNQEQVSFNGGKVRV